MTRKTREDYVSLYSAPVRLHLEHGFGPSLQEEFELLEHVQREVNEQENKTYEEHLKE